MSIRASLNQLISSVIVTVHQNSHVLDWSQIVTSIDLFSLPKAVEFFLRSFERSS